MKVILLNQNPAVSRLVRLSIEKIGYKLEEYSNIAQLDEQNPADVFICDHELVDDSVDYTPFGKHIIFLVPRNFAKKLGKHTLEKPFLPTDFMDFVKRVATSGDDEAELQEPSNSDFSDTSAENFSSDINDLDLDSFGDFDTLADDDLASQSDSASKPSDESAKSDEGLSCSKLAKDLDEPSELDTKNLDDILGQLDFEDDESKQTSDENKEVAQITEVSKKSDEGLDATLSESFVEGGEDDLIEDRIPAQLASSDVNGQDDLIEESIPENLADEKKEQLAQLSSMVDEIDNMDEQKSSAEESDDSLDMTDLKDLVGVSDKAETKEESTNEVAELEEIAEDVAPADEVVADEMPASSKLSQEEQVASLKEEMVKAEDKTAAVTGEGNEDIELSEVAGIAEASNEVGADEIASDDDSLDMTDFKELVGVSDDDMAETSDEISELSEVKDEISKVAKIAEASDEIVADEVAKTSLSDEVASGDDEFAGISESDLARALGLDIAGLSSEQEKPKEQKNNADIEQAKSQISSQITETIGATLASSPALKEAIKGMKIKINISFEE
ncbi:hypothetical protein [Campylobacter magnus]|uniref:Highly acidic protein n=1 Tax=Campylobacter magnus TaxID=3026462 RepID=A0ABT8TCS8_9BACT|nr:hypothetical protein [Campylobacter magnus]MDO2410081.1 hypothetical protein [Campylobacter magnus]